jgi:hypothetical protein
MKRSGLWIASFLTVVIVFHFCYGLRIIIPTDVSWLMTAMHDWGTHQLGWEFYRNDAWQFPIGHVDSYFHPVGTNVGFTDSIPLFAIFFKIFRPFLPSDFQYFGLWLFLCHLLAAYYTILLFRLFRVKDIYTFIAVIFVAANPVLIYRGLHPALCAHWLLIASVYVYFLDPSVVRPARILRYQFILLIIAALVNPYLCFMVLGFNVITALKLSFFQKMAKKKYFFLYIAGTFLSLFLCWYIIGLVSFGKKEDMAVSGGYGLYGLNLNSLYNSFGFSSFLPQLKWVSDHQYEGFMYLGMGMFLVLVILLVYGIVLLIKKKANLKPRYTAGHTTLVPLLILVILYTLFSITHVISLDNKVLFKLPVPGFIISIGEIFRASSRFFWVVYYLILFAIIIAVAKSRLAEYAKLAIFAAAVLLQLYDIKLMFNYRNLTHGEYSPPLDTKSWNALIGHFDEIVFYPPFQTNNLTQMDYQYFGYMAAKAGKKINTGYVPRTDNDAMKAYLDSLINDLAKGRLEPGSLYITTTSGLQYFSFPLMADSGSLHYLDGYYFIFAKSKREHDLVLLSDQLDNKNKEKIAVGISQFGNKTMFTKADPERIKHGDIRHFIETYTEKEGHLYIAGWAFREAAQNNKNDSVFIALKGEHDFYMAPSNLQLRPDITSHFQKEYLDNAGFNALIFKSGIERGTYSLGIAIKDSSGYLTYISSGKTIKEGMTEYAPVEKIAALSADENISFNAESIQSDDEMLTVSGWAYLKGQDADSSKIGLVVKMDTDYYLAWANPVARPDVTPYFRSEYKLDNSGFTIKLLKGALPPGQYQIGILIRNSQYKKQSLVFTGKDFLIR